eukprot:jgi/Psemu1/209881/e_gw1.514.22.1
MAIRASASASAITEQTNRDRYLVLVEFVYRHLNFQMAELTSVLETYGIRLGTNENSSNNSSSNNNNNNNECCWLASLPVPDNPTCSESPTVRADRRAFCVLSFPKETAARCDSGTDNIDIDIGTDGSGSGNDALSSSSSLSIADILYKCTLVKSVVELWGYSSDSLEECADRTLRWLHHNNNNNHNNINNHHHNHNGPPLSSPPQPPPSFSFQTDHVWPLVCRDKKRPWKFTIHTLGTKFRREEQDAMRQTFRKTLDCIEGPVRLKDPTAQEFLLIREIELDGNGSPLNRNSNDNSNDNSKAGRKKEFCTDAIAYYFGRVLGGRTRSSDGSRGIDHYSLKSRPYLGPTSMDAELSFVMTSLGKVRTGTIVYDPFVGTGSILLSCALRGAYCIGSDIDIRVLRGKGGDQTIWKNFEHYGLPRPEIVRTDNSLYHRHYRHHNNNNNNNNHRDSTDDSTIATPLYDAILCDPPYGIRAGARQTGSRLDNPRPVLDENRHDHIPQTKPYVVSDVMSDLLDVAARTLKVGGRLVYIIPSFTDFDEETDLPRHDCLELLHTCYQPFTHELGRRIVAMTKTTDYDLSRREDYLSTIWKHGAQSAEKCANLRDKILEAAKLKPGYEEKAKIRKEKRKAHKEAKKKEKRAKQQRQEHQEQQQEHQEHQKAPTTDL